MSGAAEASGELIAEVTAVSITSAGISAYRNHYDRTGDRAGAIFLGLLTARRWWVWSFFFLAGIAMTAIMAWGMYFIHYVIPRTDGSVNGTPWMGNASFTAKTIAIYAYCWMVLGITYCRNIDSGLHKRRWLYRRFHWLYVKTQQVPSFWLYLTIPFIQLF
jgi:hypothetical protein